MLETNYILGSSPSAKIIGGRTDAADGMRGTKQQDRSDSTTPSTTAPNNDSRITPPSPCLTQWWLLRIYKVCLPPKAGPEPGLFLI